MLQHYITKKTKKGQTPVGPDPFLHMDAGAEGAVQRDFDDKVANFVAQLLVVGTEPDKARAFLIDPLMQPFVKFNQATGVYEFYPFGISAGTT